MFFCTKCIIVACVVTLSYGRIGPYNALREAPNSNYASTQPQNQPGHIQFQNFMYGSRPLTLLPSYGRSSNSLTGAQPRYEPLKQTQVRRSAAAHQIETSASHGEVVTVPRSPDQSPGSTVKRITLSTAPTSQQFIQNPGRFLQRSSAETQSFNIHSQPAVSTASAFDAKKLLPGITSSYSVTDGSKSVQEQPGKTHQMKSLYQRTPAQAFSTPYSGSKIQAEPSSHSVVRAAAHFGAESGDRPFSPSNAQSEPQLLYESEPLSYSYSIQNVPPYSTPEGTITHQSLVQGGGSRSYQSLVDTSSSSKSQTRYSEPDPTHTSEFVEFIPSVEETYRTSSLAKSARQVRQRVSPGTPERANDFEFPESVRLSSSKQDEPPYFAASPIDTAIIPDVKPSNPVYSLRVSSSFSATAPNVTTYVPFKSFTVTEPPSPPQRREPSKPPRSTPSSTPGPTNPYEEEESDEVTPVTANSVGVQSSPISLYRYITNQNPEILRFSQTANSHEFETSNGIRVQEETEVVNTNSEPGSDGRSIVKKGSYSWIAPDGQKYEVRYTADAFGFHPEGDHIPKNLPV
ncbi:unnamed protein product [Allacma fusca]|uniref:Uncharacterized protein n=1 Tax=Allacma fusca TaxID=39272 RepID=A0A8J2LS15_9HEXA|nr:unnamed protein product [Allacma fusca]